VEGGELDRDCKHFGRKAKNLPVLEENQSGIRNGRITHSLRKKQNVKEGATMIIDEIARRLLVKKK